MSPRCRRGRPQLLHCFRRPKDRPNALAYYARMQAGTSSAPPDLVTYNTMLKYAEPSLPEAQVVRSQCLETGCGRPTGRGALTVQLCGRHERCGPGGERHALPDGVVLRSGRVHAVCLYQVCHQPSQCPRRCRGRAGLPIVTRIAVRSAVAELVGPSATRDRRERQRSGCTTKRARPGPRCGQHW